MNEINKYNGELNVFENKVSLEVRNTWKWVTIDQLGKLTIKSLLDQNNYKYVRTKKSIIIINRNRNRKEKQQELLFKYKGIGIFTNCYIRTVVDRLVRVNINRSSLHLWSTIKASSVNGTIKKPTWETLTTKYSDLKFSGTNNKRYYIHTNSEYDKENKKINIINQRRNY